MLRRLELAREMEFVDVYGLELAIGSGICTYVCAI